MSSKRLDDLKKQIDDLIEAPIYVKARRAENILLTTFVILVEQEKRIETLEGSKKNG